MLTTSVELRAERARVWERMKGINDSALAESRDLSAEEAVSWNAAREEFSSLTARIERTEYLETTPVQDEEQRVWQIRQDAIAGPAHSEEEAAERSRRAYHDAFRQYISARSLQNIGPETWDTLHQGHRPLSADEQKILKSMLSPNQYKAAMSVGSQAGGGFWVPDAAMQRIEKAMLWFGGMRQFAELIETDDGADLPWPVYDDTANSGRRLAENTAATQTDLTVGVRTFKAYVYTSDEVLVSVALLQDRPDLAEGILADALGERVARAQNTEFTTYAAGDGPQGVVPAVISALTAAATGAVTADELQRLKYAVNRDYRSHPSAAYMMADATLGSALRLTDGNGQYIFTNPNSGDEPRIWGSPVVVNNDVPALATTNRAVLFGKGHAAKIRQVKGFQLLRMDERYAPQLSVSFLGFARADSGYINAGQDPIQCITMG